MRPKSDDLLSLYNNCSLGKICGGCFYCGINYGEQLNIKDSFVRETLSRAFGLYRGPDFEYEGILPSPMEFGYRNKMEYSFGDSYKDGPLTLGLHKRKSFYDVIDADECLLVHEDCNLIVKAALSYFKDLGLTYADKRSHLGFLRHLLIRRSVKTGEILIDLVTTSQPPLSVEKHSDILRSAAGLKGYGAGNASAAESRGLPGAILKAENASMAAGRNEPGRDPKAEPDFSAGGRDLSRETPVAEQDPSARNIPDLSLSLGTGEVLSGFRDCLLNIKELKGTIRGILHTVNDSLSDAVKNEGTEILFGEDFITEDILGLKFKIGPFSFFQTNTMGAELLYSKALEYISKVLNAESVVYDLYSGTGTVAQLMAPKVKKVTGVEIVEEAAEAAGINAGMNGLKNCEFICDDVLKALDYLPPPDAIALDPPREGVNAKALKKIVDYRAQNIVYISCKAESLARDAELLGSAGYRIKNAVSLDQFPWTKNVEVILLLTLC